MNSRILYMQTKTMPATYGLIGYPLTHSFSPAYFANKFAKEGIDATYTAFPLVSIDEFLSLIWRNRQLQGLNVTIPYKESVIQYLHEIDKDAEKIGAVNCITISKGTLKGYNTDAMAFRHSLIPLIEPHHKNALILGTGGASLAVAFVLDELGIPYVRVSRQKDIDRISYDEVNASVLSRFHIIINTTPLGMYPNIDDAPPIPYKAITAKHLLYDLIYNPVETKFLALGKAQGAVIKNGYEMLHLQADASWEIWNR